MHKEILLHVSDGTADGLEIKLTVWKKKKADWKKDIVDLQDSMHAVPQR